LSGEYVSWYGGDRDQALTTPRVFFERWHAKFAFTLDGAADEGNGLLPRASTWRDPVSWKGERVFCNPPWSNIPRFVELAPDADLALLLVPARTNARWFHRALALGAQPIFWQGKLRFGDTKFNSPVDCLFLLFGVNERKHPLAPLFTNERTA
jgi:hypothetical protein